MNVFKNVDALVAFASDKMKKVNIFDTERMFCDVYCFEPNQTQTAHAHQGSDKVYYILQGTAEIRIGQETRVLSSGHAALAPSGIEHAVRNPSTERSTVLVFMAPKP